MWLRITVANPESTINCRAFFSLVGLLLHPTTVRAIFMVGDDGENIPLALFFTVNISVRPEDSWLQSLHEKNCSG